MSGVWRGGRFYPADSLSTTDVAELLGVDPRDVRRWAAAGLVPGALRLGSQWRFKRSFVERWIAEQTREPEAWRDESPSNEDVSAVV